MARILIHGDEMMRVRLEADRQENPEAWLEERRRLQAERSVLLPGEFPDDEPTLVVSQTPEEWEATQRRLEERVRQMRADEEAARKAEPPPRRRFCAPELEGRPDLYFKRRDEMLAKMKKEREKERQRDGGQGDV